MEGLAIVVLLAVPLTLNGCVSRSKAEARVRIAYLAGQRDALMQSQAHRGPTVTFLGPVNNPNVDWSEGLTLSQGIVKAAYAAATDPTSIVVHRNGQDIRTSPGQLLEGADFPLQPGDVVEIH